MSTATFVFAALLAAAFALGPSVRRWYRKGCDGCRVKDIGGAEWTHIAHTCFPWRNPYKDRKGRIWEFGRMVRDA